MNKSNNVRAYLLKGKPLTKKDCLHKFGLWNLGDLVYRMRRGGHDVQTNMIKVRDRNGTAVEVAEYRVIG